MRTALLVLMVYLSSARAYAEEISSLQQSLLFLRVLAYDRHFQSRAAGAATVAIVYRPGSRESETSAGEVNAALGNIAKKTTVSGLPIRVVSIAYEASSFDAQLSASHAVAIYVCPGLQDALAAISAATRKHASLSGTGSEAFVRGGVSIGFVERKGHPALLINLPAARAEGADLDAAVLRLAEIVR